MEGGVGKQAGSPKSPHLVAAAARRATWKSSLSRRKKVSQASHLATSCW